MENIPNNSTVVMNKPRIIKHNQKKENEFKEWN